MLSYSLEERHFLRACSTEGIYSGFVMAMEWLYCTCYFRYCLLRFRDCWDAEYFQLVLVMCFYKIDNCRIRVALAISFRKTSKSALRSPLPHMLPLIMSDDPWNPRYWQLCGVLLREGSVLIGFFKLSFPSPGDMERCARHRAKHRTKVHVFFKGHICSLDNRKHCCWVSYK